MTRRSPSPKTKTLLSATLLPASLPGAALVAAALFAAPATSQHSTSAAMQTAFNQLEHSDGWLGTPDGVEPEVWSYYQRRFALAPEGNAPDDARVGLGRLLFFDQRLSKNRDLSCASCHDPLQGFAERRPTSIGVDGQVGGRNAPTVLNAALQQSMFWDGRVKTLEEQALLPLVNPIEMGLPNLDTAVERLNELPEYALLFELAYGEGGIQADRIGKALAAFQRTLVFLDSPFDRFRGGADDAISADAKAGFEVFVQKACTSCHPVSLRQPLFTDHNFHNTGIAARATNYREVARSAFAALREAAVGATLDQLALTKEHGELGRALVTKQEYNVGAFRSSQLRNVGITAPYMHDGSLATLWDVVDHYDRGGERSPWLDPGIAPLELTVNEKDQIVAFLFTLTDRRFAAQNTAERARQKELARTRPNPEPDETGGR